MIAVYRVLASWQFWSVLYLGLVAAFLITAFSIRPSLIARLGSPEATASWDAWRSDAERSSGKDGKAVEGPVQRRTPKSKIPPAIVLLKDYFPTMLAAGIGFPSLLFAFLAMVIRGMAREALRTEKVSSTSGPRTATS